MVLDHIDISMDESYLERRVEKRLIKRLRWGKMLSIRNELLSECLIANQTSKGACLRIARYVYIPRLFILYDDCTGALHEGEVIWKKGMDLGCKFAGKPRNARTVTARRMCSKYYGL